MEKLENIFGKKSSGVTEVRNPFKKSCIKHIYLNYDNTSYTYISPDDNSRARGRVQFALGNTEGEQKFTGPTMQDVLEQMAAWCDGLEN